MSEIIDKIVNVGLYFLAQYGIIVGGLALLGLFSILSAVFNKAMDAIKFLFMIFVLFPAIIVVGLFNRSERKARLKELGEIKAHLKGSPEKWKRILYYVLFCLFVLALVLFAWWIVSFFLFPLMEFNELSKTILQNNSNYSYEVLINGS